MSPSPQSAQIGTDNIQGKGAMESLHYFTSPITHQEHNPIFPIVFLYFFFLVPWFGQRVPKTAFAASCPLPVGTPNLSSNGDLNLDTGLDVDNDLLDDLGGGGQVDEALVDAHLEEIPSLGTLTAGGLAGLLSCVLVYGTQERGLKGYKGGIGNVR